jgi:hypothetical protein
MKHRRFYFSKRLIFCESKEISINRVYELNKPKPKVAKAGNGKRVDNWFAG